MNQQNQSNTSKPQTAGSSPQSTQPKSTTSASSSSAGSTNSSSQMDSGTAMESQNKTPVRSEQTSGMQSKESSAKEASAKDSSKGLSGSPSQKHPQQNAILEPLAKFEEAIVGFAGTLSETRQNIETVVDLTLRSKDELVHIKEAFMPYLTDARDVTQKVATRVRATPSPVIWTAAGLIGSFPASDPVSAAQPAPSKHDGNRESASLWDKVFAIFR